MHTAHLFIFICIVFAYCSTSSSHQLSIVTSMVLWHGQKLTMMCYLHYLHTNVCQLPCFSLDWLYGQLLLRDIPWLVCVVIASSQCKKIKKVFKSLLKMFPNMAICGRSCTMHRKWEAYRENWSQNVELGTIRHKYYIEKPLTIAFASSQW